MSKPSWEDEPGFPRLVASAALMKYQELPSKGKPLEGTEWTPLAAIMQHDVHGRLMHMSMVPSLGVASPLYRSMDVSHHPHEGKVFPVYFPVCG